MPSVRFFPDPESLIGAYLMTFWPTRFSKICSRTRLLVIASETSKAMRCAVSSRKGSLGFRCSLIYRLDLPENFLKILLDQAFSHLFLSMKSSIESTMNPMSRIFTFLQCVFMIHLSFCIQGLSVLLLSPTHAHFRHEAGRRLPIGRCWFSNFELCSSPFGMESCSTKHDALKQKYGRRCSSSCSTACCSDSGRTRQPATSCSSSRRGSQTGPRSHRRADPCRRSHAGGLMISQILWEECPPE